MSFDHPESCYRKYIIWYNPRFDRCIYYHLKDEVHVTNENTGGFQGFAAIVTSEMPLSYENGTITTAKAGRHTIITGSVENNLLNQQQGTNRKN